MSLGGLASVVPVVGGAYGVLVLVLFLSQSRLLYQPDFPGRELTADPTRIGLVFEEVELPTEDGEQLHGWWLPHPRARGTLLFFHGNAGNISHRLDSLATFHELGLNQLIIDYRGYGRSSGKPSEQGTYLDALAAWNHLTEQRGIAPDEIVLFGRSLGAAVAAWLAADTRPGALIMESGFSSLPDLAARLYPWLPARWLVRFRYDNLAALAGVGSPVLIVHSRDDEIIPYSHAEALYAAAGQPKSLLSLRGGHNDAIFRSREAYLAGLDVFLSEHFGHHP